MSAPTPGPIAVTVAYDFYFPRHPVVVYFNDGDRPDMTKPGRSKAEAESLARLIAEAPAMLDLIRRWADIAERGHVQNVPLKNSALIAAVGEASRALLQRIDGEVSR